MYEVIEKIKRFKEEELIEVDLKLVGTRKDLLGYFFKTPFNLAKNLLKEVKIGNYKNKRSLTANAYYWALVNQIANAMRISKEEEHYNLMKDYGQCEYIAMLESVNPKNYFDYYKKIGTYKSNNNTFNSYIVYKPSHKMNSSEFAVLLDGCVMEAKNLGIETLDDLELEKLKKEYKEPQM